MPPKRRYHDDYDDAFSQFLNQRVCKPRKYVIITCYKCKLDRYVDTKYCPHCKAPRSKKCNYMEAEYTDLVWDKSCYEHDHAYDSQSDHESDEENEEHRYHAKSRAKHQKKHGGGGTDNESNNNESDGKENEDRENKTPKPVTSVKKGEQMATDEVSDSDNLYGA